MKLSEYIKRLKEIEKRSTKDLTVIFSQDDEGNNYQRVDNNLIFPTTKINEKDSFFSGELIEFNNKNFNAIIINE